MKCFRKENRGIDIEIIHTDLDPVAVDFSCPSTERIGKILERSLAVAETEWKDIWQELESLKRENKYLRNLLDVTLDKVVEIERRINRVEEKVNPGLELYYRENKGIGYAGKYNFEQIDESARELIKSLFYEAAKKISSPSFETWFTGTITDARLTEDLLIIYANNDFGRDWLETNYSDLIHEIVAKFLQREVQIQFVMDR
ncbi:MAG: hypothetical protein C6W56_11095 [Caldibacillus debilis]|nr:MAG: hypothetical protein C6W56_11095 [Caldibacillus debilis]